MFTQVGTDVTTGTPTPGRATFRVSSTAWKSGVTIATGSSQSGSWEIGKNVPENRYNGMITNRNALVRFVSSSNRALKAVPAAWKARPPSVAGTIERSAGPSSSAPNTTASTANTPEAK